jgi:hypothetical protein
MLWGEILGLIAVVCYQQQAGAKEKDDDSGKHPEYEVFPTNRLWRLGRQCRGNSDDSEDSVCTQGMFQGNGTAPIAWTVTCIPMIPAHKKKDVRAHFLAPILDITGQLEGELLWMTQI